MMNSRMQSRRTWMPTLVLTLPLLVLPAVGYAQPSCVASTLSDEQVKELIASERAARTDLPAPFPEYRSVVRKQGCHYVYIEYALPETPEENNIFRLNQHGAIVDAHSGGEPSNMKCPDEVFTESELSEIIVRAREERQDLPPAFPSYKTRVDRSRCLYLYFEYALPEKRGDYQVFTIDPLGELMEVTRSDPY